MVIDNPEQLSEESQDQLSTEEQEKLPPTGETSETEGGEGSTEAGEAEEITPEVKEQLDKLQSQLDAERSKMQSAIQKTENEKVAASEKARKDAEYTAQRVLEKAQMTQQQAEGAALEALHKEDHEEYGSTDRIKNLQNSEKVAYQWNQWFENNSAEMNRARQIADAYDISKTTGVEMEVLLKASSYEEMKQIGSYVKKSSESTGVIADLQKQIKDLQEKGKPAQEFDQNITSSTSNLSDKKFLERCIDNDYEMTEADHKRAFEIHAKKAAKG